MTLRKPSTLLIVAALIADSSSALAGDDANAANTLGAGGATAAHPTDNSAVSVNPANLGLVERYDLDAFLRIDPDTGWGWGISVVDSRTSFPLGLSYRRSSDDMPFTEEDLPGWIANGRYPANVKRYHDFTAAVALPLVSERLSMGLNTTLVFANHDRLGRSFTGNLDLGLAAAPTRGLSVGLVGRNLIPLADQPELPASLLAGVRYDLVDVGAVEVDADVRFEEPGALPLSLRAGVEGRVQTVRPRVGWQWSGPTEQHWLCWGIGSENEVGSLDYAMAIPLRSGLSFTAITHMLTLRFFT